MTVAVMFFLDRIRHLEDELASAREQRDMWRDHCAEQAKLICALTDPAPKVEVKHVVTLDAPALMRQMKHEMLTYQRRNPPRPALG